MSRTGIAAGHVSSPTVSKSPSSGLLSSDSRIHSNETPPSPLLIPGQPPPNLSGLSISSSASQALYSAHSHLLKLSPKCGKPANLKNCRTDSPTFNSIEANGHTNYYRNTSEESDHVESEEVEDGEFDEEEDVASVSGSSDDEESYQRKPLQPKTNGKAQHYSHTNGHGNGSHSAYSRSPTSSSQFFSSNAIFASVPILIQPILRRFTALGRMKLFSVFLMCFFFFLCAYLFFQLFTLSSHVAHHHRHSAAHGLIVTYSKLHGEFKQSGLHHHHSHGQPQEKEVRARIGRSNQSAALFASFIDSSAADLPSDKVVPTVAVAEPTEATVRFTDSQVLGTLAGIGVGKMSFAEVISHDKAIQSVANAFRALQFPYSKPLIYATRASAASAVTTVELPAPPTPTIASCADPAAPVVFFFVPTFEDFLSSYDPIGEHAPLALSHQGMQELTYSHYLFSILFEVFSSFLLSFSTKRSLYFLCAPPSKSLLCDSLKLRASLLPFFGNPLMDEQFCSTPLLLQRMKLELSKRGEKNTQWLDAVSNERGLDDLLWKVVGGRVMPTANAQNVPPVLTSEQRALRSLFAFQFDPVNEQNTPFYYVDFMSTCQSMGSGLAFVKSALHRNYPDAHLVSSTFSIRYFLTTRIMEPKAEVSKMYQEIVNGPIYPFLFPATELVMGVILDCRELFEHAHAGLFSMFSMYNYMQLLKDLAYQYGVRNVIVWEIIHGDGQFDMDDDGVTCSAKELQFLLPHLKIASVTSAIHNYAATKDGGDLLQSVVEDAILTVNYKNELAFSLFSLLHFYIFNDFTNIVIGSQASPQFRLLYQMQPREKSKYFHEIDGDHDSVGCFSMAYHQFRRPQYALNSHFAFDHPLTLAKYPSLARTGHKPCIQLLFSVGVPCAGTSQLYGFLHGQPAALINDKFPVHLELSDLFSALYQSPFGVEEYWNVRKKIMVVLRRMIDEVYGNDVAPLDAGGNNVGFGLASGGEMLRAHIRVNLHEDARNDKSMLHATPSVMQYVVAYYFPHYINFQFLFFYPEQVRSCTLMMGSHLPTLPKFLEFEWQFTWETRVLRDLLVIMDREKATIHPSNVFLIDLSTSKGKSAEEQTVQAKQLFWFLFRGSDADLKSESMRAAFISDFHGLVNHTVPVPPSPPIPAFYLTSKYYNALASRWNRHGGPKVNFHAEYDKNNYRSDGVTLTEKQERMMNGMMAGMEHLDSMKNHNLWLTFFISQQLLRAPLDISRFQLEAVLQPEEHSLPPFTHLWSALKALQFPSDCSAKHRKFLVYDYSFHRQRQRRYDNKDNTDSIFVWSEKELIDELMVLISTLSVALATQRVLVIPPVYSPSQADGKPTNDDSKTSRYLVDYLQPLSSCSLEDTGVHVLFHADEFHYYMEVPMNDDSYGIDPYSNDRVVISHSNQIDVSYVSAYQRAHPYDQTMGLQGYLSSLATFVFRPLDWIEKNINEYVEKWLTTDGLLMWRDFSHIPFLSLSLPCMMTGVTLEQYAAMLAHEFSIHSYQKIYLSKSCSWSFNHLQKVNEHFKAQQSAQDPRSFQAPPYKVHTPYLGSFHTVNQKLSEEETALLKQLKELLMQEYGIDASLILVSEFRSPLCTAFKHKDNDFFIYDSLIDLFILSRSQMLLSTHATDEGLLLNLLLFPHSDRLDIEESLLQSRHANNPALAPSLEDMRVALLDQKYVDVYGFELVNAFEFHQWIREANHYQATREGREFIIKVDGKHRDLLKFFPFGLPAAENPSSSGLLSAVSRVFSHTPQLSPLKFIPKKVFDPHFRVVFFIGIEGSGHHFFQHVLRQTRYYSSTKYPRIFHPTMRSEAYASDGAWSAWRHDSFIAWQKEQKSFIAECEYVRGSSAQRRIGLFGGQETEYPSLLVLNVVSDGGSGMMSYPNMEGEGRSMRHPNAPFFALLAEENNIDIRFVVISRSPGSMLASTIQRNHGVTKTHNDQDLAFNYQARILHDNIAFVDYDLSVIDPAFYTVIDLSDAVYSPKRVSGEFAQHLGVPMDGMERALKTLSSSFHVTHPHSFYTKFTREQRVSNFDTYNFYHRLTHPAGLTYPIGAVNSFRHPFYCYIPTQLRRKSERRDHRLFIMGLSGSGEKLVRFVLEQATGMLTSDEHGKSILADADPKLTIPSIVEHNLKHWGAAGETIAHSLSLSFPGCSRFDREHSPKEHDLGVIQEVWKQMILKSVPAAEGDYTPAYIFLLRHPLSWSSYTSYSCFYKDRIILSTPHTFTLITKYIEEYVIHTESDIYEYQSHLLRFLYSYYHVLLSTYALHLNPDSPPLFHASNAEEERKYQTFLRAKKLFIHYEDLIEKPEQTFGQIFDFMSENEILPKPFSFSEEIRKSTDESCTAELFRKIFPSQETLSAYFKSVSETQIFGELAADPSEPKNLFADYSKYFEYILRSGTINLLKIVNGWEEQNEKIPLFWLDTIIRRFFDELFNQLTSLVKTLKIPFKLDGEVFGSNIDAWQLYRNKLGRQLKEKISASGYQKIKWSAQRRPNQ